MLEHFNSIKLICSAILTLTCLASTPISVADSYEEKQVLLQELFEIARINETIDSMPASFHSQIDAELAKLVSPDAQAEELEYFASIREMASDLLSAEDIKHSVRMSMNDTMSTSDIADMIAWYSSDFGRKILDIEKLASTGIFQSSVKAEMLAVSESEKIQREQLLQQIMKISGIDELLLTMARGMGKSVISGMSRTVNQEMQPHLQQATAEMDRKIENMKDPLNYHLLAFMKNTYQVLGISALTRYAADLGQAAFVAMNKSVVDGVTKSLNDSGYELGASMGEYIVRVSEIES